MMAKATARLDVRRLAALGDLELAIPKCVKGIGSVIGSPESPELIAGVRVQPLALFPDDRGYFLEVQRMGRGLAAEFPAATTQVSAALNFAGAVKAFHYHLHQTDCWTPVKGMLQVALVDLRLPDMDGLELVSRLHAVSQLTQVVILTGNASLQSAIRAMQAQSCDYLVKPVSPDLLLRTVAGAGERWQRRRAEEALRTTEERNRLLIENIADLILVIDRGGVIQYASPSSPQVAGWEPPELTGRQVLELVHPDDEARTEESLADVRVQPSSLGSIEFKFRHKDGSWRMMDAVIRNLLDQPELGGWVLTARDVSERHRLMAEFLQAQKMESVGRLAGGIAHDFNNLLSVIMGHAELALAEEALASERHADLKGIVRAAERAASLIRQLLAFSRRQVLELRVVDLNAVVADTEQMLRRLLGEDLELVTLLSPQIAPIKADAGQLQQVLLNLAVNARDAMPGGGRITIETANAVLDQTYADTHGRLGPGRYAMLALSDTGVGMDPATQASIFEPFFTTKAPGKGTGLGLATVHGIVTQSGGHIWVYSEMGRGTTFKIYFPRVDEPVVLARAAEEQGALPQGTETVCGCSGSRATPYGRPPAVMRRWPGCERPRTGSTSCSPTPSSPEWQARMWRNGRRRDSRAFASCTCPGTPPQPWCTKGSWNRRWLCSRSPLPPRTWH